jgi:flagellar hook-associated protein 1 FlgK
MSDLLSLLSLGSNALVAQNTGVAVATNNVANANTVGYSRERPDIAGFKVGNTTRLADDLLQGQIQTAAGSLAMSQAFADALSELGTGLTSGGSIDEQIGALFSRFNQAAAAPTDSASRNAVMAAARDLVAGIQRRAASVAAARREADARIRDGATSATALAKQLAAANTAVARSSDPEAKDQRDRVAKQLGELVGGRARIDADGQMRYVLDGGAVLVDGIHAAQLNATTDPATGNARLEVVAGAASRDVTTQIAGGSLGAHLKFRDQTLTSVSGQLDQLAFDLTSSVNTVHAAHAGLDGIAGRPLFTPLTGVAGAADAIAIDPGIAGDPSRLALGTPGAGPGDNQGALALFALGSQKVAAAGTRTLGDAAIDVVAGVGASASDAKGDATRDGLITEHLAGLRDSLSGVDTQEELTNLARFEHISGAVAKFVSTIDGMLGSLIDSL